MVVVIRGAVVGIVALAIDIGHRRSGRMVQALSIAVDHGGSFGELGFVKWLGPGCRRADSSERRNI